MAAETHLKPITKLTIASAINHSNTVITTYLSRCAGLWDFHIFQLIFI